MISGGRNLSFYPTLNIPLNDVVLFLLLPFVMMLGKLYHRIFSFFKRFYLLVFLEREGERSIDLLFAY